MANKQTSKRRILEQNSDDDINTGCELIKKNDHWQRFILLESLSTEKVLTKLSPFAIQKGISGIAGTVKDVKKLRSGQILVECSKKAHADNLLRANTLAGVPIKATFHPYLNSSRGIIRTRELQDMDESEITTELTQEGVTSVKRISIRKGDQIIKTGTYILTFNKSQPPEWIRLGYLRVPVDIFIPNPLRCFNCQRFGHSSAGCNNKSICHNCGEERHEGNCSKLSKCRNCTGDHPSSSKICSSWIKEKEIQKVKGLKRVNYADARKEVEKLPIFRFEKSFAAVVLPTKQEAECQTGLTWLTREKPQLISKTSSSIKKKTQSTQTSSQTQTETIEDQSVIVEIPVTSKGKKSQHSTRAQQQKFSQENRLQKADSLKDVNMAEPTISRSRSSSPKSRSKGQVLVLPT